MGLNGVGMFEEVSEDGLCDGVGAILGNVSYGDIIFFCLVKVNDVVTCCHDTDISEFKCLFEGIFFESEFIEH